MRGGTRSIVHYGTEQIWMVLTGDYNEAVKLETLCKLAIGLGLRCSSEPTTKLFASLWMLCSWPDCQSMSKFSKYEKKEYLKKEFDKYRTRAPEATEHMEKLPSSPAQLQIRNPIIYSSVYTGDNAPVPAAVDLQALAKNK